MLRRIPAVLSALVLAAHFLRAGRPLATASLVMLPILFFVRTRWAVLASRGILLAGAAVWVVTAGRLARARLAAGEPYARMAVILGAVAAFTAVAAWLLPGEQGEESR